MHMLLGALGAIAGAAGAAPSAQTVAQAAPTSSIVGLWKQVGVYCVGEAVPLIGFEKIGEFRLRADGSFAVTWRPFESYEDYWGTYAFDPFTGALTMTAAGGNKVHPEADLAGTARIETDGKLRLDGVCFGHDPAQKPSDCAILFERL